MVEPWCLVVFPGLPGYADVKAPITESPHRCGGDLSSPGFAQRSQARLAWLACLPARQATFIDVGADVVRRQGDEAAKTGAFRVPHAPGLRALSPLAMALSHVSCYCICEPPARTPHRMEALLERLEHLHMPLHLPYQCCAGVAQGGSRP